VRKYGDNFWYISLNDKRPKIDRCFRNGLNVRSTFRNIILASRFLFFNEGGLRIMKQVLDRIKKLFGRTNGLVTT
jgi:hypothetical protein